MDTRTLQFLGAAGTVTGSKHLVSAGGSRVLLDCGLFQGLKDLRLRNRSEPGEALRDLDAITLSHAHIDHSGYVPLVVNRGFRGPIYCTPGTADLLRILLPDSGKLQEEDAERANEHGYSRHHPALPLYTRDDAVRALEFLEPRPQHQTFTVTGGITALFRPAGHILGAATVELGVGGTRLVFSGDLGRRGHEFLSDPEQVPAADVLVMESTYGDRSHAPDPAARLAALITSAAELDGAIIIPAFAVGRTQEILWILRRLEEAGRIPVLPVYVDSPMAIDVTEITSRHPEGLKIDPVILKDPGRNPLRAANVHFTQTPAESRKINDIAGPVIIISSSGMATGGRVLYHLRLRLPNPRTTVLLPGFQAEGTRGRELQDGAIEVRIHGKAVPVRARIEMIHGLSGHADKEGLLDWLSGFRKPPTRVYLVHGEPAQAAALARTIQDRLKWNARAAVDGETVALE